LGFYKRKGDKKIRRKVKTTYSSLLADDRSGDDDVGIYNQTLDLRSLAGKKTAFDWDGKDGTSGWVHIQVERVDYF